MRDEVYEPLGLAPARTARPAARRPRRTDFPVAIAILAFVAGLVAPASREALRRGEPVAAETMKPQTAKAETAAGPAEPPAAVAEAPPRPAAAAADRGDEAGGVKIVRKGAAGAPIPLIIDVRRELALAKLKAALDAEH